MKPKTFYEIVKDYHDYLCEQNPDSFHDINTYFPFIDAKIGKEESFYTCEVLIKYPYTGEKLLWAYKASSIVIAFNDGNIEKYFLYQLKLRLGDYLKDGK
jgi:hypothetical protein